MNENRQHPMCPICGKECETVYYFRDELLGCDNCITSVEAEYVDECFDDYPED